MRARGAGTGCWCRVLVQVPARGCGCRGRRAGLPSATGLLHPSLYWGRSSLPWCLLSLLSPGDARHRLGGIRAAVVPEQLGGEDTQPPLSSRPSKEHLPGGGCVGFGTGQARAERLVPSAIARPGWGWCAAPGVPGTAGAGGAAGGCWPATPLSAPSPCAGGAALVPAAP